MTVWLLTWFWQGLTVTLAIGILLKAKRINASTRYLVWWGALLAVLWLGYASSPYLADPIPVPVPGSDPNGTEFAQEPYLLVTEASPLLVSMFLGVWAAIALVKLIRLLPSLHAVYALRDRCRAFPDGIESRLPLWLEANSRGRRAELMVCDAVPGATVLGFQRPSIALSSSLVDALSVEELDQIILHEQAHVQRYDDWARLAQGLLQAALWIHPAVTLIGRSLNREREMACDERVVARTGLPKAFARCLTRAAEVRSRTRVGPMLVPALFGRPHHLVRRVNRLLAVKGSTRCDVSRLAATAAACVIAGLSSQLRAVPLVGERVTSTLPRVESPSVRNVFVAADSTEDRAVALVQLQSRPVPQPARRTNARREPDERHEPYEPDELHEPDEPDEPAEPGELHHSPNPSALASRTISGAYESPDAPQTFDQPRVWRSAAIPGVEIANAARKTGVGIAGMVSRAGVSLARSF